MNVLIRFAHGLGDAVQFSVVLKHLRHHRPDWNIDVWGLRGKHSAWRGLCRGVYHDQEGPPPGPYDQVVDLGWYENYSSYPDRPNSKITNCLADVFRVSYEPHLGRYEVRPDPTDYAAARAYLESIGCKPTPAGRYNAVLLHYEGNTSGPKKNLEHHQAAAVCESAIAAGRVPVILDWDNRSPLPDQARVFCPRVGPGDPWGGFGSGDAARITAMISLAELFVGIDSGPGKCASATDTPTVLVWTGHHPVQFHDPAPNTVHLVPESHATLPPLAGSPALATYFAANYRHRPYTDLTGDLARVVGAHLTEERTDGRPVVGGFVCHPGKADQDWVVIQDVYVNDCYRTYLIPKRPGPETVIDVGAHVGTFARLWHERNPEARIVCVEVEPGNAALVRENCPHATVVEAACVGAGAGPVYRLSALGPAGRSTGGTRVVGRDERDREADPQYEKPRRRVRTVTLAGLMRRYRLARIDLLKLDCEGAEFGILETADLSRIGFIVGEYHGWERFRELLAARFPEPAWSFGHMSQTGDLGNFHLRNNRYKPG